MSKDNAGGTPLHNASRLRYLGLVEMLLEVDVDVNVRNAEEDTPLHITTSRGNVEMSRYLIKRGLSRCELLRQPWLDSSPHSGTDWPPRHRAALARPRC